MGLLLFCCAGLVDPRLGLGALVLFSLAGEFHCWRGEDDLEFSSVR